MKTTVHTDNAPAAIGPYSQGVTGEGRTFYISGQIPIDPKTGAFAGATIEEQTRQSLANLAAILAEAGGSLDSVVKTTVFLQSIDDFAAMNEIYGQTFSAPYPARSAVEVAKLPKGALVEIEAIAVI